MSPRLQRPAFRWAFVLLTIIGALASMPAFSQSTVIKTMTIDVTNYCCVDPTYCAGWSDGVVVLDQFTDPLPRSAKLRSVSFLWRTGNTHTFSWQSIPHVAMSLNGTSLGEFDITNTADCVPGGAQDWAFNSQDYTNGFPGYVYGTTGQNTVSITISNTGGNVAAQWGDHRTLTLTYEAPAPIEFSVTDSATEGDRRIILSNSEPGYPYPHFQSLGGRDAEVPMFLRTKDQNGNYTTGTTVYMRVIDPADTAPYMNLSTNTLARTGDNNGPPPIIDGSGVTAVPNMVGIYQGTSGTNGELDFTLKLQQGTAGGDNYQVEASFDQTFPTGLRWHSGTLTAWKRLFVEKNNELQNGIPLSSESAIGASTIHVADIHYRGNQGGKRTVRAGDRVILVHAPAIDRQNAPQGWYSEEHNVADVAQNATDYVVTLGTRNGNKITPESLQHAFGRDPSQPSQPAYSDQMARLSGATLSSADYYDAPTDLVNGTGNPFTAAFVEYYLLPRGPFGFVPMPDYGTDNEAILQTFGEKWCLSGAGTSTAPNHQLLVIGDSDMTSTSPTGATVSQVGGQTSSWVWRGVIQQQVGTQGTNPGGDPNLWAEKTSAHELAHEFKTNTVFNLADHCPSATVSYDAPTLYCLMASLDSAGGVQAQRTNGIARFHLLHLQNGTWHSEYLEIRKHADPFLP